MPPRSYQVKRLRLGFEKGALFYAALNLRLFILLLINPYDYLFANDLDTLPAAYLASRLKRKPLLYDSHELFTEVPELVSRPRIQHFWLKIEQRILPHLKEMITVNESIAAIFKSTYSIPVNVVRNVPHRQEQLNALSREELNLKPTQKMLIIQGSGLNVQRGIEEAILAMELIDDAVLFLVGDGDVIPSVKKIVATKNLQEKVRFVGRLPYEQLLQYTAAADLGLALDKPLSLNYALALPNKVFDYIQAQTPIVTSPLVEIQKLIDRYDCGEVIQEVSPEALAQKINTLCSNPERLAILKENCKKAAAVEHWDGDKKVLAEVVGRVFI